MSTPLDELGAIDAALLEAVDPAATALRRLAREGGLGRTSWDRTTNAMLRLVDEAVMTRRLVARRRESERVRRTA